MALQMDPRDVFWLMLPALPPGDEKLGKDVVCLKAKAKGVTGAIKKVAKSGHFWAVLRAENPGVTAVLLTTLKTLGYSVKGHDLAAFKRAAGSVADDLLAHISTPLTVLPSEADVHSLGSSGAADPSERPPTREEIILSAYDDAASQATSSAKGLRIAEANRAAELRKDAAAKEAADRERQFILDELEKAERGAERERQQREREAKEAAERERQAADKLLAAVARAASAEARATAAEEARAARCCEVM
jgi:hypothetical protein